MIDRIKLVLAVLLLCYCSGSKREIAIDASYDFGGNTRVIVDKVKLGLGNMKVENDNTCSDKDEVIRVINLDISSSFSGSDGVLEIISLIRENICNSNINIKSRMNRISKHGMIEILENILSKRNETGVNIECLDFGSNFLNLSNDKDMHKDGKELCKLLQKLVESDVNCPRKLCLDGCGLIPSVCRALGKGMMKDKGKRLRCLDLSCNPGIGDEGAAAIAASLKSGAIVDDLNLSSCGIGDLGAKAIAIALESSPGCLSNLNLNNNDITDEGVMALGKALSSWSKGNTIMSSMKLDNNPSIGDVGSEALAVALGCGILKSISLRCCAIRSYGALSLGRALVSLSSLLMKQRLHGNYTIDLSGNELGTYRPSFKKPTASSYLTFIGNKFKTNTAESDDEFEEEDQSTSDKVPRCGIRSFVEPFLSVDSDSHDINNNEEADSSNINCFLGLRHCALDVGAAEALAAAILQARRKNKYGTIHFNVDVMLNSGLDSHTSQAFSSPTLLKNMAQKHFKAMDILRSARQKAFEASSFAAERARKEAISNLANYDYDEEELLSSDYYDDDYDF